MKKFIPILAFVLLLLNVGTMAQTTEIYEPANLILEFPEGWFIEGTNDQGSLIYLSEYADIKAVVYKMEIPDFDEAVEYVTGLIKSEVEKGNAMYKELEMDFDIDERVEMFVCEQKSDENYDFYATMIETPNGSVSITFVGFLKDLESHKDEIRYIINNISYLE